MCVRVWVGKIWVGRCTGPTTTRANNSTRKERQRETERDRGDRAVQESASSEEDAEGQKVARDRINGR